MTDPNHKDDRSICKRQLKKAIQANNLEQVKMLCGIWSDKIGIEVVVEIISKELLEDDECFQASMWLISQIAPPSSKERLGELALDSIFEVLIKAGLTPGTDFSLLDGSIYLSEKAQEALMDAIPADKRDNARKNFNKLLIEREQDKSFIEAMHDRLGTPFYENLPNISRDRIKRNFFASNQWIAGYLVSILAGLVQRNRELIHIEYPRHFLAYVLQDFGLERASEIFDFIADGNVDGSPAQEGLWLMDIQQALGLKQQQVMTDKGLEDVISEDNLKVVDLVWQGSERLINLALMLEKARKGLR